MKFILASLLGIVVGMWGEIALQSHDAKTIHSAIVVHACGGYVGTVFVHKDGTQEADQGDPKRLFDVFEALSNAQHLGMVQIPCLPAQDPEARDTLGQDPTVNQI